MNLRTRVDRLYDRLRPQRAVYVIYGHGPPVSQSPGGHSATLRVPCDGEFEGSPFSRLTAAQRAFIRPNDRVIVIAFAERGLTDEHFGGTAQGSEESREEEERDGDDD